MVRTQIYLPEDLMLELKLRATADGVNMSEYIRQAVQASFKKTKPKKNNSLGQLKGLISAKPLTNSSKELSKEIDKIVYGV